MMDNVFVCNHCKTGFTLEDSERWICDGESWTVCPNCGSGDIEEGEMCEVCREIDYPWKMKHGVCEHCFKDAVSAFKAVLEYLQPWEREVLEAEYRNLDVTEN
jgi:hypothetical protein